MIVSCQTCGKAYRMTSLKKEEFQILDRDEWRINFPCITPLCNGRMVRHRKPPESGAEDIPLSVFYRSLMGFGHPSDKDTATLENVMRNFLTKNVVEVKAEETGDPKRVILENLTLEDGTKMHFAASSKGACLYYVEGPDALDPDGNPEVRAQD